MNKKNLYQIIASLSLISGFSAVSQAVEVPRGQDIDPLAAHCTIGPFPQVTKAGPYNALCSVMQDSEKCLALIKGAFHYNGEEVIIFPIKKSDKGRYCLDVLKRDLGLELE